MQSLLPFDGRATQPLQTAAMTLDGLTGQRRPVSDLLTLPDEAQRHYVILVLAGGAGMAGVKRLRSLSVAER